jgi:hypothetical protein
MKHTIVNTYKYIKANSLLLAFFLLTLQGVVAQDSTRKSSSHNVMLALQAGNSKHFDGIGGTFAYSYRTTNNIFMLSALNVAEATTFGSESRQFLEYAFTYHRIMAFRRLDLGIGTGISYNLHKLNINDIYVAVDDEILRKNNWGFPLFITLTHQTGKRITIGGHLHGNLNNINNVGLVGVHCNFSF